VEGNGISIPTHATVPLTEVLRANVSGGRVAMPVRGSSYARLQHINAIPALSGSGGYPISRLQAIDSLLTRIANMQESATPDLDIDPLEQHQELMEEAALRIATDIQTGGNRYGLAEGFLLDMTA
jgi:hypothetical protein